ncbi:MAG TPA: DinB family protein [Chitinophagaceae bacterium]
MMIGTTNTEQLFELLDAATSEFLEMVLSFDERGLNTIPYPGSWTVGQVAEHVTRSNLGIAKDLQIKGQVSEREPDKGAEKLKSIFLDFDKKLSSPSFILPTQNQYKKDHLLSDLKSSIEIITTACKHEDLFQLINHPIFGEVTKLEIVYFVVYHTQRHIHQLEKIKTLMNANGC